MPHHFLFNPKITVTLIMAEILSIFTVVSQMPASTWDNLMKGDPIHRILAFLAIATAVVTAIGAGLGRSPVSAVDGMTTVSIPTNAKLDVHVPDKDQPPSPTSGVA